jgi:DNA (cytosine-5)-methyltransferase 1
MTFLDLCAGIGGFTLGLERAGMICVGQIEIDRFCNRILTRHWPSVPKWGDIKEVRPDELPDFELVCGGYPCQPFSCAGKRKGADDPRHLWPYIRTIIAAKRPNWCLFENVVGHISMGLDEVLADLEALDYTATAVCIPACAIGANHERERVWILANANSMRLSRGFDGDSLEIEPKTNAALSPACRIRIPRLHDIPTPRITRAHDGISRRAHRIHSLGGTIVPQIAETIGRIILEVNK